MCTCITLWGFFCQCWRLQNEMFCCKTRCFAFLHKKTNEFQISGWEISKEGFCSKKTFSLQLLFFHFTLVKGILEYCTSMNSLIVWVGRVEKYSQRVLCLPGLYSISVSLYMESFSAPLQSEMFSINSELSSDLNYSH